MAVPTSISDCNATAANNSPAGSDSIGTSLDDYLRSHAAILRQVYDYTLANMLPLAGGTVTGQIKGIAPVAAADLTRKDYVDGLITTIVSGTYTPSLSNDNNCASLTSALFMYSRVGSVVTVSGRVTIQPTSSSVETRFTLTLPIASNLAAAEDLIGVMNVRKTTNEQWSGTVEGSVSDVALTRYYPSATGTHQNWIQFQYIIK